MSRPSLSRAALAVALVLAFVVPPAAGHAASRNLLVNPGFEERLGNHPWMPAGWDTSVTGLPTTFFGCDTFLVHSGHYAANVANISNFLPMAHNWSQTVLVGREAWGKDLVFTVWTRSNGVAGRAYCLLQAYRDTITKMSRIWDVPRTEAASRLGIHATDDPLMDTGWKRLMFMEPETDWVRRELRVYCPPTTNVAFVRCGLLGTGQLLIDDASLTLEDPQPAPALRVGENLIRDPGFEGDGTDWEYVMPPYAGLSVERDTTQSHGGRACMRYESLIGPQYPTAPVHARMGVCQSIVNRNLGGKRIKMSAWVKTDSLKGIAYIKIYANAAGGMVQGIASVQYSLNTPWTLTTQTLDLPPGTWEVWAWCLYDAPVPGQVYFDDVSLAVEGPVPPPAPIKAVRSKK